MQIDGTLNKLTTVRAILDIISLFYFIFFWLILINMTDHVHAYFTGKSKL